jgi:hypothetical protein
MTLITTAGLWWETERSSARSYRVFGGWRPTTPTLSPRDQCCCCCRTARGCFYPLVCRHGSSIGRYKFSSPSFVLSASPSTSLLMCFLIDLVNYIEVLLILDWWIEAPMPRCVHVTSHYRMRCFSWDVPFWQSNFHTTISVCLIIKILRIWTTSSSALIGKIYFLWSEKSVEPVVQLRFANNQKIASTLAVSWCSMKILHLYLGKH